MERAFNQNRIERAPSLTDLAGRVREFIRALDGDEAPPEEVFNELAIELFRAQVAQVPPYQRLCRHRQIDPFGVSRWVNIPAVPTTAFKDYEFTSIRREECCSVFHSSGTSGHRPSRHFHCEASLALYEASLQVWLRAHLTPDPDVAGRLRFLALTPPPVEAPHSSLVHMFGTIFRETAVAVGEGCFAATVASDGGWQLRTDEALAFLRTATTAGEPVCLLGPAFAHVHLLEAMEARRVDLQLLPASRLMETGGYKGRSREVSREELRAWISRRLGVAPEFIVGEYGMSELSSQAYDHVAGKPMNDGPAAFRFPPWARARVVSPETGDEVANGEVGLVRVFDLANVWSVLAVEAGDLARRRGDGFELLGRAAQAEPRGCSLMPADGLEEASP